MIVNAGYDVNDPDQNPGEFLTDELRTVASEKYIQLFERVTGASFQFPESGNAKTRIEQSLQNLLK
jgi:hypothetical protein